MKTFTLSAPVTIDGTTYSELNFRNLRFGDVEALFVAKSEMEAMRILLARLADVPESVISALEIADVTGMLETMASEVDKVAGVVLK